MNCGSPLGHKIAGAFTPSPITGFDLICVYLLRQRERRCDVCDEITDFFHKLSQFPLTVINDDMDNLIVGLFVSE